MKHIGWFLILLSLGCFFGWFWQVKEARNRAASYEPVDAFVVSNRIVKSWAGGSAYQYRPEYLFEYKRNGVTYQRWERGSLITTQRFRAEAELGRLCPGSRTTIYVNPEDPRQIALAITGADTDSNALAFAALSLSFGISGVVVSRRPRRGLS
jgi:hypothetical protein